MKLLIRGRLHDSWFLVPSSQCRSSWPAHVSPPNADVGAKHFSGDRHFSTGQPEADACSTFHLPSSIVRWSSMRSRTDRSMSSIEMRPSIIIFRNGRRILRLYCSLMTGKSIEYEHRIIGHLLTTTWQSEFMEWQWPVLLLSATSTGIFSSSYYRNE